MGHRKRKTESPLIQRKLPDGRTEYIDRLTGELKFIGKASVSDEQRKKDGSPVRNVVESVRERYVWKNNKNGVPLLVGKHDNARDLPDDYQLFKYNNELALNICQLIAEGMTLKRIGQMKDFPPSSVILHWYFKDEQFREAIDNARKMRAEVFHDELVNIAETVREEDTKSAKVKIDAFKYLMEVNDKERFGTVPKMPSTENTFTFVFDTGINREKEVIDVQAESIRETPDTGGVPEAGPSDEGEESHECPSDQERIDGVCAQEVPIGDPQEPQEV